MQNSESIKTLVREKYSQIARQSKAQNERSCCGSDCCGGEVSNIMADSYESLAGYNADADLGLGCGLPTEFAQIEPGDTVVDLGSGAGNDAFVARAITGQHGRVIGVDMTKTMLVLARRNAKKLGFENVEFVEGDIENIPLPENTADVVVSNCVFNLVPDKARAFAETYRILKPGGHFSISDVVVKGEVPAGLRDNAELYVGCVAGAIDHEVYLDTVRNQGFENITVQKFRPIDLPAGLLEKYLTVEELERYDAGEFGIFSSTVYAEK